MAAEDVFAFLGAIDQELAGHAGPGETLDLHLLGRSALILGYGLSLMTKDVDVVQTVGSRLFDIAVDVFRKNGPDHQSHGFYLEAVSSGLPPLPHGFKQRCVDVSGPWQIIRPKPLEVHDLIVTKLRRFHAGDRLDVQILCDTGDVDVVILRERFEQANHFSDMDEPKVVFSLKNLEAIAEYLDGLRRSL
jgi:hypothetical protein